MTQMGFWEIEVHLEYAAKGETDKVKETFRTFSSLELLISPLQLYNNLKESVCISTSVLTNFVFVS